MACPMCREPVTLGGGIGITKGSLPRSKLGLKYPWDSHLASNNHNQNITYILTIIHASKCEPLKAKRKKKTETKIETIMTPKQPEPSFIYQYKSIKGSKSNNLNANSFATAKRQQQKPFSTTQDYFALCVKIKVLIIGPRPWFGPQHQGL